MSLSAMSPQGLKLILKYVDWDEQGAVASTDTICQCARVYGDCVGVRAGLPRFNFQFDQTLKDRDGGYG